MAVYRCVICGAIWDEEKEGKPLSELDACPVCKQPISKFEKIEDTPAKPETSAVRSDLDYDPAFARQDSGIRYMSEIHEMSVTGHSIHAAMGTQMPMPSWDDILMKGAQLDPAPLNDGDPVVTKTIIGKNAAKPMVLETPVFVSHMSFGALSKEAKTALSRGAAMAKTAMCSGEGGILPEEKAAAYKYIFEYIPNKYSVTDDTVGEDVQSPSKFPEINSREDLKNMVANLRKLSDGRPIGIKISAGNIEADLAYCLAAEPDFITIDGRGGATGSSPYFLREATTVPTIFALTRARKFLDEQGSDVSLIITGGLRVSSDIAKALALGADAVAVATGALMAAGCQQYRICGSGNCPVGIATQDPELRKRLDMDAAAQRVGNYLNVLTEELKTFARITGNESVHDLSLKELMTTSRDIADFTEIPYVGKA